MSDLDAEIEAILAREAERKANTTPTEPADDVMHKVLAKAFAKAERAHRRATESVYVRVFEC